MEKRRFGNKLGEITQVEILDKDYQRATVFTSGDIVHIRIHVILHVDIPENLTIGCTIKNRFCEVYGTNTKWQLLD